jgi:antiviral defense system Shedu protein SduA
LKEQPKFLYALGAYEAAVSEVSFPSGITDSTGRPIRLRLDFLLQDTSGIWDVVELKKADFGELALIVGQLQRRKFAAVVESAIAQVKTYLRELDRPEAQESLLDSGIVVEQPQAWLIIGRDKDLPPRERRLLERDLPRQLRLVTYDQLCDLAKQRAVIVTNAMLLPCIEPLVVPATAQFLEAVAQAQPTTDQDIPYRLIQDALKSARWTVADMKTERRYRKELRDRRIVSQPPRPRTLIRPFFDKLKKP